MYLPYQLMQGERLICKMDCAIPFLACLVILVVGILTVYLIYR
ncbi:unnamed protein product, partial [marine sediment metagenome]